MKDQIFIGWSGTNNVALEIKKRLEAKNYRCYIGGNADNSSQFSSVGDTVIQQIKNCNQAIMIFQIAGSPLQMCILRQRGSSKGEQSKKS